MKKVFKALVLIISVVFVMTMFSSCNESTKQSPVAVDDFRVTAYVVSSRLGDKIFDSSNLSRVTDVILFGNANFSENGELVLSDGFDDELSYLRGYLTNQHLYLNILGPSSLSDSDDWNEQMYDLADRHTKAFESGVLEENILNVLSKYDFDGVVFDYEFPLRSKDWKAFDKFILSLDKTLGDDYKIGMSMVGWNLKQSKSAMQATDFFEIMSYDLWDDDGNHATVKIAQEDIELFRKKGYDMATLDLGVPFYARPTTKDAVWYDYKDYYDKIDDNGLASDEENSLTASFNTYDVIKEKTHIAYENGLGGMMIWHYSCDVPADNEKSLFGAIETARQELDGE